MNYKQIPFDLLDDQTKNNVFSKERILKAPQTELPDVLLPNTPLQMDGIKFMNLIPNATIPVVFFDPQYRGILDKMGYGNEGKKRGKDRSDLPQMTEETIVNFINKINDILMPSGHLFLWIDKFHVCEGFQHWINSTELEIVDMVIWNKNKMGMGYRTRRVSEYCIIIQKQPKKAKGVWKIHDIPDVWLEKVNSKTHPHQKPLFLQSMLIEAVSNKGDFIVDPAAGSFSVMKAAIFKERNFLGCDLNV